MKNILRLFGFIFASGLVCACASPALNVPPTATLAPSTALATAAPAPTATFTPVKLKVVYLRFFSYAPYFIADAEGFFTEQGLDVELVPSTSMGQNVPAFLQGQLDVLAATNNAAYFNAIGRGGRMAFVADKGYVDPKGCATSAIVARASLAKTLDSPDKIRGLKVSLSAGSINNYMFDKFLSARGLSLGDIKSNSVVPDDLLAQSLENGALDMAVATEPSLTRVLQDKNIVKVATAEQLFPGSTFAFMLYGPNLLDKNPEAGKRFMVAYLKAVRQYNQGKTDRNLDILTKYTGQDRETLNAVCWQPIRSDGKINVPSLIDYQEHLVRQKLLDNPVNDEQKLYDPRFINYANDVLK